MKTITPRQRAIAAGKPWYETGAPCKRGHVGERSTRTRACRTCKQRPRTYTLNTLAKNAHRGRLGRLKETAGHTKAFPKWANLDTILLVYKIAALMRQQTGIAYEVDHIAPLHGETVSGLHIASNLQIITKEQNKRKGQSYEQ